MTSVYKTFSLDIIIKGILCVQAKEFFLFNTDIVYIYPPTEKIILS